MDQYKLEAVKRMLATSKIDTSKLIAEIRKLENEIRECYAEPIEWDGETLSWMLAMDGCFILEFLKSFALERSESDINRFSLVFQNVNKHNVMCGKILNDIIKLENQIPLCILITLLKLEFPNPKKPTKVLAKLLNNFLIFRGRPFISSSPDTKQKLKEHIQKNPCPCHLLDLYRIVIKDLLTNSSPASVTTIESSECGGTHNSNSDRRRCGWWRNVVLPGWIERLSCIIPSGQSPDDSRSTPCARLLQVAGIKFQPGKLRFDKKWFGSSTLYLPQIYVDDDTETRLRNLMAYEECQRGSWSPEDTVISQYVYLFNDLIDSEKDVSILKKSQVILSLAASDKEIAHMFNHIKHGIIFDPSEEIEAVIRQARDHYKSQWRVWISQFKEEYCSKPWYIASLLVAILILGMTSVQTVYSVKK